MNNTIVTYETFHGSAKRIAQIISERLDCNCINIDTPFEAENLKDIHNIILVFNFRGPYTAQLTKLYLSRVKDQIKNKNIILVGEGLFSKQEFPIVAKEINELYPSHTFNTFFVTGQLRVATLSKEEQVMLKTFGELTGMEIKDMGELDLDEAGNVAESILKLINSDGFILPEEEIREEKKFKCKVCGYIHSGDNPPDKCPLCGVGPDLFEEI